MIIGPGVVIEDGVCMSKTTVLSDAKIKSHAWIRQSIIGWKSVVGKWVIKLMHQSTLHVQYL